MRQDIQISNGKDPFMIGSSEMMNWILKDIISGIIPRIGKK